MPLVTRKIRAEKLVPMGRPPVYEPPIDGIEDLVGCPNPMPERGGTVRAADVKGSRPRHDLEPRITPQPPVSVHDRLESRQQITLSARQVSR